MKSSIIHLENVKNAIFVTGTGSFDHYQHCAWQILGEEEFMPLPGSQAFIEKINQLERVPEYKVEIICTEDQIKAAVAALKKTILMNHLLIMHFALR